MARPGISTRNTEKTCGIIRDFIRDVGRDQKINANFLYKVSRQPFGSWTSAPKIVDVCTKKCVFPVAPVVGRNFLTPGHPGVRVQNVRGKSGPRSLCLPPVFYYYVINSEQLL